MSRLCGLLRRCGDLIGQLLAGCIKLKPCLPNDMGHCFDGPTLGGYRHLIVSMNDLVQQLCIPLDRTHCIIESGLEGHLCFLLKGL